MLYSSLAAAGPTAVACWVLGSIPISPTPPTPPWTTLTRGPELSGQPALLRGKAVGTDRLPSSARSWPKELMKCEVEKRGALKASSGFMPNST